MEDGGAPICPPRRCFIWSRAHVTTICLLLERMFLLPTPNTHRHTHIHNPPLKLVSNHPKKGGGRGSGASTGGRWSHDGQSGSSPVRLNDSEPCGRTSEAQMCRRGALGTYVVPGGIPLARLTGGQHTSHPPDARPPFLSHAIAAAPGQDAHRVP